MIAATTLTSKGQLTLPKAIRDRFNLKAGDRLEVSAEGDRIVMVPATLDLESLCAILPRPARVAALDEITAAVRKRAARRSR